MLPGCLSEGKTEAEGLNNIQDAIKLHLADVEAEAKEKKAKLVQVTVRDRAGKTIWEPHNPEESRGRSHYSPET